MSSIQQVEKALVYLANRCNGATSLDTMGYNGTDTNFGRSLASFVQQGRKLSAKQLELGLKMLKKYEQTQLASVGLILPPPHQLKNDIVARDSGVIKIGRNVSMRGEDIIVRFDYDSSVLTAVKSVYPRGAFSDMNRDDKHWVFKLESIKSLIEKLLPFGFKFSDELLEHIQVVQEEERILSEECSDRVSWVKGYLASNDDLPFTPFKHQLEAVEFFFSQDNYRCLVADDMGLGKSLSALMTAKAFQAKMLFDEDINVKVFVISPASVKINWFKEAEKVDIKIEVFSSAKVPQPPAYTKYLVIADECHMFQNIKSKRTEKFLDLVDNDNCLGLIAMSGTPMKNGRPSNLYPILKAIKHPIADSKSRYEKRYCDAHPTAFTSWDTTGASNLEELNVKISDKMIRRTKEECLDLPPKLYNDIECESNSEAEYEYQQSLTDLKALYQERVEAGEISDRARAIVFLTYFRRLASIYKSYQAIEMVEDLLEQGKQVVVMCDFVESAERIAAHFNTPALTGKTPQEKTIDGVKVYPRQQMKEDFQNGINKVFVSTIKAGGVGITLTAASYLIMVDKPWTNGDYDQATDRIYRIGQTMTCNIYDLYAKEIDYIMADILNHKKENIDKVLKKLKVAGKKNDANYFDNLVKALVKLS